MTEACHLAAKEGVPCAQVVAFIKHMRLNPVSLANELAAIGAPLDRYADTPMDFADACVVRLAELHAGASVCTTDNHFSFFRQNGSEPISVLAPFSR